MRYFYQGTSKDGTGKIICEATISVYLAGGYTVASVYTTMTGGVAVNSVTSGATESSNPGYFGFWVDTVDYSLDQRFRIVISKAGFNPQIYDYVFAAINMANVTGLPGLLADDQHVLDAEVLAVAAALAHKTRHQDTGADEISVTGLSGLLADDQHVLDAEVLAVAIAKSDTLTGFTKATLPTPGTPGRIVRVTDNVRGLWMDQGVQWFGLNGEMANVKEFGATGNGTTDDTAAIQAAINAAGTGMVFFPQGNYLISTTLNISGNYTGVSLLGVHSGLNGLGSMITWNGGTTTPMIDGTGSNNIDLQNLLIRAPVGKPAMVGVLFGRSGEASAGFHSIKNVFIHGYFLIAGLYEVTSEVNIYINLQIFNQYAGYYYTNTYGYIHTIAVEFGVTSPYQTLTASDGNTLGTWIGGCIVSTTCPAMRLRGGMNFSMFGTHLYSGDTGAAAIIMAGAGNGEFANSAITFDTVRVEGTADNTIYFSTPDIFRKIRMENCQLIGVTNSLNGINGAEIRELRLKGNVIGGNNVINVAVLRDSEITAIDQDIIIRTDATRNRFFGHNIVYFQGTHTGNVIQSTGADQTLCA